MHPIIKSEIEKIETILDDKGHGRLIVEQGPDVDINTYQEGERYFATKKPWIVRINAANNKDFDVMEKEGLLKKFNRLSNKDSWCAVLLYPENTDMDYFDNIRDTVSLWLWKKGVVGYALLICPKLTKWETMEGWYKEFLFLDQKSQVYAIFKP